MLMVVYFGFWKRDRKADSVNYKMRDIGGKRVRGEIERRGERRKVREID